jgi:hypothetical protein
VYAEGDVDDGSESSGDDTSSDEDIFEYESAGEDEELPASLSHNFFDAFIQADGILSTADWAVDNARSSLQALRTSYPMSTASPTLLATVQRLFEELQHWGSH